MADIQALCMKCRDENNKPTKQTVVDLQTEEKGGKYFGRGKCSNCGGNVFKILSKEDKQALNIQ